MIAHDHLTYERTGTSPEYRAEGRESQDGPHFQTCLEYLETQCALNTPLSSPPPPHRNILLANGCSVTQSDTAALHQINLEVCCLWKIYAPDVLSSQLRQTSSTEASGGWWREWWMDWSGSGGCLFPLNQTLVGAFFCPQPLFQSALMGPND